MAKVIVKQAAERKGVTVNAIYAALQEGKLTRHEEYGVALVDEDELARYQPRAYRQRAPIRPARITPPG